ncbi:1-deoxy-D-xylulose-5-phosphate reductoisomerase [Spiroplasma endosymbiont of Labia minor]|uniref:1-deoxy-D-xylulose-5-phosphate reductoisomerase n=1 Tax=Spiroplasma endosymbiont of Labia minor TaxID=3066305 RepID=UPI0030D2FE9C
MKKKVIIFGASGSIGTQCIEILNQFETEFEIIAVSVFENQEFLKNFLDTNNDIKFAFTNKNFVYENNFSNIKFWNENIIKNIPQEIEFDLAINAISGFAGFEISLWILNKNKTLLLANKESLVVGGHLIKELLKQNKEARLYPIDSEHAAIWQCLDKENKIEKILLTASGGNFIDKTIDQLNEINYEDAFKHPNWKMGAEITINSSTMFNKALEIIEAYHLFNTTDIDVLIHKQSIIHSMVQFSDKSIIAQLSKPDMKQVINYFLHYPKRKNYNQASQLDFDKLINLTLQNIDVKRFKPISFAKQCLTENNSSAISLNAANEIAVQAFIDKKILFKDITNIVEKIFLLTKPKKITDFKSILEFDLLIREQTKKIIIDKEW